MPPSAFVYHGTIAGFFIGFIVVYQILYTDVSNHLPQFATMKAMGFTDRFLLQLVIRQDCCWPYLGYIPGSIWRLPSIKSSKRGLRLR